MQLASPNRCARPLEGTDKLTTHPKKKGLCTLSDERVRLFHARYTIIALTGDEYLLICPYLTEAGNISGIVVVTVTKMILGRS